MAVQQQLQRVIDFLKKFSLMRDTRLGKFLIDVLAELQNVTWPSWEDIKTSTAVVFVTIIIMSAFMGLAGWGTNWIHKHFIRFMIELLSQPSGMM